MYQGNRKSHGIYRDEIRNNLYNESTAERIDKMERKKKKDKRNTGLKLIVVAWWRSEMMA